MDTGFTYYSDRSLNPDRINHVYATPFAGGVIHSFNPVSFPGGIFVGFEDLHGGGDLNYNDLTFVFTNAAVGPSVVPVPAALPLFASVLGLGGLFGYRRKRKAAMA